MQNNILLPIQDLMRAQLGLHIAATKRRRIEPESCTMQSRIKFKVRQQILSNRGQQSPNSNNRKQGGIIR